MNPATNIFVESETDEFVTTWSEFVCTNSDAFDADDIARIEQSLMIGDSVPVNGGTGRGVILSLVRPA